MEIKKFKIENEDVKKRLDVFLLENVEKTSRSQIKIAIDNGNVFVNGKVVKAGYCLKNSDEVVFEIQEKKQLNALPQNIDINIVFEDDVLAVINKEQGMVVHPANGNTDGTLANALAFKFNNLSTVNGCIRPGIVHRLDKDTSGLLVVAKTDEAHRILADEISKKIAVRKYFAILEGVVKEDCGTVEKNLKRSDKDKTKYCVCEKNQGKTAITHYSVVKRFKEHTLCEFKLETGRTHQIRVHASYLNHPVVGDRVYGFKNQKFKTRGQLLHSHFLGFYHPTTNEWIEFETYLPKHFEEIIKKL